MITKNSTKIVGRKGTESAAEFKNTVRLHSPMIYTDFFEYKNIGDTKAPLNRCFPFVSKLKAGDIINNEQYMNCQTFSKQQFRPLLKNSLHSIRIDLRDTSGEEIPFVPVDITRLAMMFRKASRLHFSWTQETLQDGCFKISRNSIREKYWSTAWMGFWWICTK